ncbi:phosphoglycerate mutase, partial [Candidatus Poribacteria bacterium]|nr:phosphoglycerate mutase [Candidatus Poribacteria bacterium]
MADFPLDELGGKTPLEAADTPHMDAIAAAGVVGLVDVIPATQKPGSDVGNLSVMGYDPDEYLTGRAPLEAASMGVPLSPTDVAFRCNLVTLDGDLMLDYSAGHITSEEASELIEAVSAAIGTPDRGFHAGVQYRHLMVVHERGEGAVCVPPHDIMGEPFRD